MKVPALDSRQTRVATWVLRLLSLVVIGLVVSTSHTQIDRTEIATPAYAIAAGHPSQAYVMAGSTGSPTFQAPGFPILAGGVIAFWDRLAGPGGAPGALTFAGDLAVALVVLAGCWLIRTRRDRRRRDELVFLGAVTISPFFREALGSYFHPDDVLAFGFLLLALGLVEQRSWLWAGLSLGVAIGCKQWALLGVPALVLMAPDRPARARLLLSSLGGAAIVYLPFVFVSPGSAWPLVRGPAAVAGGFDPQTTIIAMLHQGSLRVSVETVNHMARSLPLLTAVAMAGAYVVLVNRRWQRPYLNLDQALALLIACFAARLVEDSIALSYYALPFVLLVLVLEVRQARPPIFAVASAFGLAMWYGSGLHTYRMGRWLGAEVFTVAVLMIAAGTLVPFYYRLGAGAVGERTGTAGADPAEVSTR